MNEEATEPNSETPSRARRKRSGGRGGARAAKRAARSNVAGGAKPYFTRKIPVFSVLDDEGLSRIEESAETVLEEIGIDFATTLKHCRYGAKPVPR